MDKELQVILTQQNINADSMKTLADAFGAPFTEAGEIIKSYKDIKVTDESQLDLMASAREKRLTLRKIRTGVESKRKELKEDYLRAGKAIDGVARYIKETIEPAEEYLELQEKFIEIKLAKEQAEKLANRTAEMMKYTDNLALYNIKDIDDLQFETLLGKVKKDFDDRIEAERLATEAQAESDKKAEDERLAMIAENARLRAEADAKDKAEAEEREAREAIERKAEQEKQAEAERVGKIKVALLEYAHNIKTVEDCDSQAKRLETYADSLKPLDRENPVVDAAYHRSKSDIVEMRQYLSDQETKAEAARKLAVEAKAKADAEAEELKTLLSPDKDKLIAYADRVATLIQELPAVKTKQAQSIVSGIEDMLTVAIETIKAQAKNL